MSVYIKGMEMPQDDMKNIMILADGRVFQFSGYGNPKPLGIAIPVPPHGRLIDADAIKYTYTTVYGSDDGHNRLDYVVGIDEIDEMPAIIPADIKTMYYPQVDGITPTVIKPKRRKQNG